MPPASPLDPPPGKILTDKAHVLTSLSRFVHWKCKAVKTRVREYRILLFLTSLSFPCEVLKPTLKCSQLKNSNYSLYIGTHGCCIKHNVTSRLVTLCACLICSFEGTLRDTNSAMVTIPYFKIPRSPLLYY